MCVSSGRTCITYSLLCYRQHCLSLYYHHPMYTRSFEFIGSCVCVCVLAGCWFEGREVANGETLAPSGNPCRRCNCKSGVITCTEPICDCSVATSRKDKCCPQCDPAASCRHQELHHLVFRSGERWIYQCQTCECLVSILYTHMSQYIIILLLLYDKMFVIACLKKKKKTVWRD